MSEYIGFANCIISLNRGRRPVWQPNAHPDGAGAEPCDLIEQPDGSSGVKGTRGRDGKRNPLLEAGEGKAERRRDEVGRRVGSEEGRREATMRRGLESQLRG